VTAPAGPCEQCGGPQWWTIVSGEMYTKCKAGCLWLDLEGEVLLPPKCDLESIGSITQRVMEQLGRRGLVPCEGGDANLSDKSLIGDHPTDDLPF